MWDIRVGKTRAYLPATIQTLPSDKAFGMVRRVVFLSLVLGTFTLHAQTPAMQAANEGIHRFIQPLLSSLK